MKELKSVTKLNFTVDELAWEKCNDMIPVIVQNYLTGVVLMQGFMNKEALNKTLEIGKVTFFSRTKNRLWTKGEESRHYLNLIDISCDCDKDCLLIAADPIGPTCHRGTESCFDGHLPLATSNIAAYKANNNENNDVIKAVDDFNKESSIDNAASMLKSILTLLQSKNINLKDVDKLVK
jgi:phosphoribosyl-AMP cyclohydrolase